MPEYADNNNLPTSPLLARKLKINTENPDLVRSGRFKHISGREDDYGQKNAQVRI